MKVDQAKKLHQKKYRQQMKAFLLEGEHLVLELLRAVNRYPALAQSQLFVTEKYAGFQHQLPQQLVGERAMMQLSETKSPQGIVAVVPQLTVPAQGDELGVYLHQVQDPGNLGTIMRSLAWFGGFQLLLSPGSVDPYNAKVLRASMGAVLHLPLELDVGPEYLLNRYRQFAALDMQGESISVMAARKPDCLLFGNEARGLPASLVQTLNASRYTITGCGIIESLNLASALNMCVWELMR